MNDFDVVTGPAPGILPACRTPVPPPRQSAPSDASRPRDDEKPASARLASEAPAKGSP